MVTTTENLGAHCSPEIGGYIEYLPLSFEFTAIIVFPSMPITSMSITYKGERKGRGLAKVS
jgi:hypothetical protein